MCPRDWLLLGNCDSYSARLPALKASRDGICDCHNIRQHDSTTLINIDGLHHSVRAVGARRGGPSPPAPLPKGEGRM
jgi:hypothetical protein